MHLFNRGQEAKQRPRNRQEPRDQQEDNHYRIFFTGFVMGLLRASQFERYGSGVEIQYAFLVGNFYALIRLLYADPREGGIARGASYLSGLLAGLCVSTFLPGSPTLKKLEGVNELLSNDTSSNSYRYGW